MNYFSGLLTLSRRVIATFKSHSGLQYLFILALVLRLCYLVFMLGQITSDEIMKLTPDTIRYVNTGRELLDFHIVDEGAVFIFGPGYGAFLALVFFFFGVGPLAVLLIQVLLSSLGCLLIYKLGKELTESKAVGAIAGILAATSFTSISLSVTILSDCLFFFLFLLGNLLFVLGFKQERLSYFVWSGVIIGASILVRSIGQFWPLVMLIMSFLLTAITPVGERLGNKRELWRKAVIAPLVAIVLMTGWIIRNHQVCQVPVVAFAGPHGVAKLTASTQMRLQNTEYMGVVDNWVNRYKAERGITDLTNRDLYEVYRREAWWTLRNHPKEMSSVYLSLVWENLTAVNEFYRVQLPRDANMMIDAMNWLRAKSIHLVCFWLSMAGFLMMLLLGRWKPVLFLGLMYLYFVIMLGFGSWQGSRLFFPAQIAWAVAIAFLLVYLWGTVVSLSRKIFSYSTAK